MSTGYVRSWPKPEICCDGASRRPPEVKRTCLGELSERESLVPDRLCPWQGRLSGEVPHCPQLSGGVLRDPKATSFWDRVPLYKCCLASQPATVSVRACSLPTK